MEKPSSAKTELTILRSYFWILLVLWTVLVGAILSWSLFRHKHETEGVALIQAQGSFENDLVYRRWAADHGGVYVPMTDKTPPNPYLSHIEERDITTPSGRVLTLVNPAYMTRQVHEMGLEQYGSRGHITSLNPIRAANAPDEWETKALQAFEQGVKEVSSIEKIDNQNYMRLMRPMITEESCLKCHSEQGYKVGDLRGGISISVPMAPIQAVAMGQKLTLVVGHFVLWLLGAGGISLGWQRLKRRVQERTYAEEQIENLAKFPSENPNPVLRIARDGKLLYANAAAESLVTQWDCHVGQTVPGNWQNIIADAFQKGTEQRAEIDHDGKVFSFAITPVIDADYANLYGRDITERKQAEEYLCRYECIVLNSNDMIALMDSDFTYLAANEGYVKAFGMSNEEVIGHTAPDVFGEEFFGRVIRPHAEECLSGHEVHYQDWFNLPAYGQRYMDIAYFPYRGQDKQVRGFVVHARDITERKKVEEALQKAHDELEIRVMERTEQLQNTVGTLQSEVTDRIKAEEQIRADQRQLRHLATELLLAEERERRAIATELHDSIGQILAFSSIELGNMTKSSSVQATKDLKRVRKHIDQAITAMRTLTLDLSPPILYTFGLEAAVEQLAEQYSEEHGFRYNLMCGDDSKPMSNEIEVLLYRSVRELFVNIAKHAKANTVKIAVDRVDNMIKITIEDDGVGFDQSKVGNVSDELKGFGLFSIRERLSHFGGSFEIQSGLGRGTKVMLTAPLENKDENKNGD